MCEHLPDIILALKSILDVVAARNCICDSVVRRRRSLPATSAFDSGVAQGLELPLIASPAAQTRRSPSRRNFRA